MTPKSFQESLASFGCSKNRVEDIEIALNSVHKALSALSPESVYILEFFGLHTILNEYAETSNKRKLFKEDNIKENDKSH